MYVRRSHKPSSNNKDQNPALIKLMVCLAVLGIVMIARTVQPEKTRQILAEYVLGGTDYTEALSDVGESLKAFFQGAPRPEDVETILDATSSESSITPQDDGVKITTPEPWEPEDSYDAENEPAPDTTLGMGGFGEPVLALREDYLPQGDGAGEDDTEPVPFGMQVPERVDYSVYELPFESKSPASGTVSSGFGYRIHPVYNVWAFHYGIDIANNKGTAITAFAKGTVSAAGYSSSYGNYIILEHSNGYATVYAHCSKVYVKAGDSIKLGQKIAAMGSTGVATGPHLHFEIRLDDKLLDPAGYLGEL